MDQPDFEFQLNVWKELAISKQILMKTAAEALRLDPNYTQEQLKETLERTVKKLAKADADVAAAREEAKKAIAIAEIKLTQAQKAQAAAEAQIATLQAAQDAGVKNAEGRQAAHVQELQKFKNQLAEKDKALKAITTALSDTPENVLRKMNALKKQKQEEADGRKELEKAFNTLRGDKMKQEGALRESGKLAKQHRELHGVCTTLHEKLEALVEKKKEVPTVPELDEKLLETIEKPAAKLDKA